MVFHGTQFAFYLQSFHAFTHAKNVMYLNVIMIGLQTLVDSDPTGLVPQVLSALQAARSTPTHQQLLMNPQPPEVRDAMRCKEAAYLSACVLDSVQGSLDVGEWLQGSLLPEMNLVRRILVCSVLAGGLYCFCLASGSSQQPIIMQYIRQLKRPVHFFAFSACEWFPACSYHIKAH